MDIWKERTKRLLSRSHNQISDMNRSMRWWVYGGRNYYKKHAHEILSNHKWCFIASCNNSGSSLLQKILDNSGKVSAMTNEGQKYTKVLQRAHRKGFERIWSEYISELRLDESDSIECVPRLLHDWMPVFRKPIRKILLEKTTTNSIRMRWLQNAFPNSYFIGLIRNGYAVTEGIKRKGKKSTSRSARHWNLVNKIMIEDSKYIKNFHLLRYEDMVENFELTSKKLGEFLEIDHALIHDGMKRQFSFDTIRGEDKQKITNLNIDSIKRLKQSDKQIIEKEANEMLIKFNYSCIQ